MATKRITGMDAAATLTGDELVEVSQLSTTVTMTSTTLSALASDNSYNDSAAQFIVEGFAVGDRVRVAGFTGNVANNILVGAITALTTSKMTIGGTDGNVIVDDAAGESVTIAKWTSKRTTVDDLVAGGGGGGGGGATVLDDLTDVDAATPADGDALVWDSGTSMWIPAAVGAGAPIGWEIVGTYDFAVDGALAQKDFTGLGDYMELKITGRCGTSVSASIQCRLSDDNGATFYSTSGDYYTIDGNGVDSSAGTTIVTSGGGVSTSTKMLNMSIVGNGSTVTGISTTALLPRRFVASSTFNALRVFSSSGNISSGKFVVWGMRAA